MVKEVMHEGEVVGLNPAGRVARGKYRDLRWGWKNFAIFLKFFAVYLLPSVLFCREPH